MVLYICTHDFLLHHKNNQNYTYTYYRYFLSKDDQITAINVTLIMDKQGISTRTKKVCIYIYIRTTNTVNFIQKYDIG